MDETPKSGLLAAYVRLLGPLVRILIRNGVSFDEFSNVAKQTYVEVAGRDFQVGKKKSSQTRLEILTGLDATEVGNVLDSLKSTSDKDQNTLDGIVRVLTAWHTDSKYTGPYGMPIELEYEESDNTGFNELSQRYCPGIEPRSLLKELVSVGAVVETEKGWFKVLTRSYGPQASAPAGLEYLGRTLADIVKTLDHNILEPNPKNRLFERHVYTEDGIRPEDLPKFVKFTNERGQQLLDEIDNWLTQLDKPNESTDQKLSTGLGIFHYIHHGDEYK
jgi:hypothetical protein